MTLGGTAPFLAAAAVAVLADQGSKALAARLPAGGLHLGVHRAGLERVLNARGSVLATPLRWAIALWVAGVAGAGLALAQGRLDAVGVIGIGLALGGATSNLADRVLRGAVVDFIALRFWPTFNVADAAMVAGWALLAGSLA